MPTSSEMVKRRREDEAWEDRMQQLRAAEASRPKVDPAPEPVEPAAPAEAEDDG